MDTAYLQQQLGPCLTTCLVEVSQKRPYDPIEFMAHWLYKYKQNVQYAEQVAADEVQLAKEKEEYEQEQIRLAELLKEKESFDAEAEKIRREIYEKKRGVAEALGNVVSVADKLDEMLDLITLSERKPPPIVKVDEEEEDAEKKALEEQSSKDRLAQGSDLPTLVEGEEPKLETPRGEGDTQSSEDTA